MSFQRPTEDSIRQFLAQQSKLNFTYTAVGATSGTPPAGYVVDHTRIKLGEGERVFQSAIGALQRWEHFRLGWVEAWPPDTTIAAGNVVAIIGRVLGMWWLNACRIVAVENSLSDPVSRFGFFYGTLPGHMESGEERFLIEWDHGDNSVWYDILAFSRPNHFLARLGYPYVRHTQKRFGRDSAAAMLKSAGGAFQESQTQQVNDL